MDSRNKTIDVAKGLLIFLVVLGHLQNDGNNLANVLINLCHMPGFFFLSGLFFNHSANKYIGVNFVYNKFFTLLVPYIIWSFVSLAFNILLEVVNGNTNKVTREIFDIFINARSVWFLIVLFITNIVLWFIKIISNGNIRLFMSICVVLWGASLFLDKVSILQLYKFRWLFPYFVLGIVCSEKVQINNLLFDDKIIKVQSKILLIALSAASYFVSSIWLYVSIDKYNEFMGGNWVIYNIGQYIIIYLIGMIGIVSIWIIADLITQNISINKLIGYLGRHSIDVYLIHMFLIKILTIFIFPMLSPNFINQIFFITCDIIIVSVICLCTFFFLDKKIVYKISVGKYSYNSRNRQLVR